MAGRWQPYTFAPAKPLLSMADIDPSRPTFDPKAVTRASRMPPPPPKKKPEGPLIDFNKHPDSFLVLPYGNTNAKPMSPKTKFIIDVARWTQFGLRIITILGAVGVLLCGIFIRGAQDTEGYILRIPPGVDLVISLYAIYHLIRNPKNRPAGSSASYHFFALVTDAGFIPFYVFTILMARRNYDMKPGDKGRWVSMFPTDAETNKILFTTWVTAIAVAALHLVSTFLDMYMALVFRKIAKLPPDMNPLESNLTSRRKAKHKHKNSSISAMQPLTGSDEKNGDRNTIYSDRNSKAESYYPDVPSPTKNQIAFIHTRTKSDTLYSPHTPASARQSREHFSMYSQPPSAHQSRKNLNHRDDLLRDEDEDLTLAQRKTMLTNQGNIKRHSRANSHVTTASKKEQYTAYSPVKQEEKEEATGDLSMQRNSQRSLREDNWFVQADHDDDDHDDDHNAPAPKQSIFASTNATKGYSSVTAYEVVSDPEDDADAQDAMLPRPLRMNPPSLTDMAQHYQQNTPPPSYPQSANLHSHALTTSSPERPHSRSSTPKSRRYGNLQEAAAAVRSGHSATPSNTSPTKGSSFRRQPNHFPSATKQYSVNNVSSPAPSNTAPFSLNKKSYTSIKRTGEANSIPVKHHQSPRVISRSGVDYNGAFAFDSDDGADLGVPTMGRRRDVSGKVAEEGRGGLGWQGSGMVQRKVSGVAQAF